MDMTGPIGPNPLDKPGLVGQPLDRVDGRDKVTGAARYAYEKRDDVANAAVGYLVTASIAHGRIAAIDAVATRRSPGVLLVLTHENAPPQGTGNHREACPQLTGPEVAHYGQPVALVVAETFEQARAAAFLLQVTYTEEKHETDLAANTARAAVPPAAGNPTDSTVGSFEEAFAGAPVKLDETYTTPLQTHAMMEPHATTAVWNGDKLVLHTSNQMLNQGVKSVARTLKLDPENVRLISPYIGGGFGAKLWVMADAILAAMAAKQLDRPVKVALTRQQLFHVTTHRSDTIQRIRLGAGRDGRLMAIGHDSISGNLALPQGYEAAAFQTRTLYAGANRQTRHRLVPLDVPIASAMRAPGEAVGLLALEIAVDELAERLSLDPIQLRILNEPTEDPEKHVPFSTRNLVSCLREGARRFGWDRRQAQPAQVRDGRWLVGMGVAAAIRNNPLQASKAGVRLGPDGVLTVRTAMTDIGTGSYTILTQIAADLLGLPAAKVSMLLGDTAYPQASGSGGSFGAASSGSAVYDACMNLRAKLAQAAGINSAEAEFADGKVTAGPISRPLATLAGADGLEAEGEIKPGDMTKRFSQQSYGAHFSEVGVDMDTGEIRVRRMLGVFTAGRILNAKTARSQALGGMIFGIGAALEEEVHLDPRFGEYVNHDLAEYHVPVHADVPALDVVFLDEIDDKTNPLKSKGIGELGICGAGAAIANAVYNACGVRVRDYPLTLDKVLGKLPAA
jgi:xanthine dehydrogenase YagR molybdenum-binding subunit